MMKMKIERRVRRRASAASRARMVVPINGRGSNAPTIPHQVREIPSFTTMAHEILVLCNDPKINPPGELGDFAVQWFIRLACRTLM
jgi:hypothetical protein